MAFQIIDWIITAIVGIGGIWLGYMLTSRQALHDQSRQEKWQELNYWRGVLAQYDSEAQKIDRPSIPLGYIYTDRQENPASSLPPLQQRMMREGRAARQRVEALARELGVDPGLPTPNLPAQQSMTNWQ